MGDTVAKFILLHWLLDGTLLLCMCGSYLHSFIIRGCCCLQLSLISTFQSSYQQVCQLGHETLNGKNQTKRINFSAFKESTLQSLIIVKHPIHRVETRKYIYICIGGQKGFLVFYVGSNGQELRDTTEAEMMNTFFSLSHYF